MQPRVEGAEASTGAVKRSFKRAVEACSASGKNFAGLGKPLSRIVAQDGGCQFRNLALMLAKLATDCRFHAEAEVIQALLQLMQQRTDAPLGTAHRQPCEPLSRQQQLEACGAFQAV
jgi:hypothetical protein